MNIDTTIKLIKEYREAHPDADGIEILAYINSQLSLEQQSLKLFEEM